MSRLTGRLSKRSKYASLPSAGLIAFAGAVSLGVAVGVGRFAFTPLLPLMLHEGTVDLAFGSHLATANYLGYLIGAMICMAMPRRWSVGCIIQASLAATVLLTFAMALPFATPRIWLLLRFLAGVSSATAFVFTSGWCLAELAFLNAPSLGSLIFAGPGAGIALSGLATTAMIAAHWQAASGWIAFACIAAIASASVWNVFVRSNHPVKLSSPPSSSHTETKNDATPEMTIIALAYGLAGFGYIITATFLPVIARTAIPNTIWLDLFWPAFGGAAFVGAILATRLRPSFDSRLVLAYACFCQAAGILFTEVCPNVIGFAIGSLLVGLPFTAISYFAMQQVRRLQPRSISWFMGLLTSLYGLGQIAGPPVAGWLLTISASTGAGFAASQTLASATLLLSGTLIIAATQIWPEHGVD